MSTKFNSAFWKWFGKSKVVDKTGSPLVVYHGTDSRFTKFKPVSYFAEEARYAEFFTLGSGAILPCYLSIQNPLDLTIFALKRIRIDDFLDFFSNAGVVLGEVDAAFRKYRYGVHEAAWGFIRDVTADKDLSAIFAKAMLDAGFDGIAQDESYGGVQEKFRVWVPMRASQIKSATGNDGTWDADDDDIRSNPGQPSLRDLIDAATEAEHLGDLDMRNRIALLILKHKVINFDDGSYVETWYDKRSRHYITEPVGKGGDYIGNSGYTWTKGDAAVAHLWAAADRMKKAGLVDE